MKAVEGKFTEADLHRIKFNTAYAPTGSYMKAFKALYELDENKYPEIADAIRKFKHWNLSGELDNEDAALAMITHEFLREKADAPFAFLMIRKKRVSEEDAVWAITKAKKLLLKTHGSLDVPLSEVQRLIRGDKSLPTDGLREVPRAADTKLYKKRKGIYKVTKGDGYIQVARFPKKGLPEVKSINAYGASNHPDSPHYDDQMELFTNHQFKKMSFDKEKILKSAERIYSPGAE